MKYKICTYNLRMDTPEDGKNAFSQRKAFIAERFPLYGADVVGFQEVLPHMRRWLEETLTDYQVVGTGRGATLEDEHNVIAYRRDRFLLVALDTFWLSDTPYVPGSRFACDQSPCPRICTCAVLATRDTRQLLRVYNTHLDHEGAGARTQGMACILCRIAADDSRYPGAPVVLMGDFNAEPEEAACRMAGEFAACGRRLEDMTREIPATYHDYHRSQPIKIDYIFTSADWDKSATRALTDCHEGVYLSDHYPVLGEIFL